MYVYFEKLFWTPEHIHVFKANLKELNTLDEPKHTLLVNVNQAVNTFTAITKRVSECIIKEINKWRREPRRTWFDNQFQEAKAEVKRSFRIFRRNNLVQDKNIYAELRKQYKKLLKTKSDSYKVEMTSKLLNSTKTSKKQFGLRWKQSPPRER